MEEKKCYFPALHGYNEGSVSFCLTKVFVVQELLVPEMVR